MFDAVLLDWEGVLADTASARRHALVRALSEEGICLDADAYALHCDGQLVAVGIARALAHLGLHDATLAELVALRATRAFADRLGQGFVLIPGAREFVEQVQHAARVAIVTSATRSATEFMLRLAGLDGAISTIVSADDGLEAPPAPATYERAREHLARRRPLRREYVVAIATTPPALRAARAAGLRTVALGAPAHVAIDADGAVDAIDGLSPSDLARVAGISVPERQR